MLLRILVFLGLNFGALALGGLFTGSGVSSDWYQGLSKAPWTPPGWVFGAAWTTIMVCFTVWMAFAWERADAPALLGGLFALQWVLNVAWNPVFFAWQQPLTALVIIALLTLLVGYLLFSWMPVLKLKSLLLLPYFVWLLIATSLNAWIVLKN